MDNLDNGVDELNMDKLEDNIDNIIEILNNDLSNKLVCIKQESINEKENLLNEIKDDLISNNSENSKFINNVKYSNSHYGDKFQNSNFSLNKNLKFNIDSKILSNSNYNSNNNFNPNPNDFLKKIFSELKVPITSDKNLVFDPKINVKEIYTPFNGNLESVFNKLSEVNKNNSFTKKEKKELDNRLVPKIENNSLNYLYGCEFKNKICSENPFIDNMNKNTNVIKSKKPYIEFRYLNFRPLVNSLDIKINTSQDKGYYFKVISYEFQLIKNTLEDNGFKDISYKINRDTIDNGINLRKLDSKNDDKSKRSFSNRSETNSINFISKRQNTSKGESRSKSKSINLNLNTSNITILWTGSCLKLSQYEQLSQYIKINHFPKSGELTRKDLLFKNISYLSEKYKKEFEFIPISYILPNESRDLELAMQSNANSGCSWIIKPVSSSQGRGIFMVNKYSDIPLSKNHLIACKYIHNPLLINNYKFDLRIYVLLLSVKPLKILIYNEGLVRFATEKYNEDELMINKYAHLTNYAINKENTNKFVNNKDILNDNIGSKWSLSALKSNLKNKVRII